MNSPSDADLDELAVAYWRCYDSRWGALGELSEATADAWLEALRSGPAEPLSDECLSVSIDVDDLISVGGETAIRLIVVLANNVHDKEDRLGFLGAGPIEELFFRHPDMYPRLKELSLANPALAVALRFARRD